MTLTNATSADRRTAAGDADQLDREQHDAHQQAQAAQTALSNATGVNVDDEMQTSADRCRQTYAATTQVIQAAAKMLDELTSMGT